MLAVSAILATALMAQAAPATAKKETKAKPDTTVVKKAAPAPKHEAKKGTKPATKENKQAKENKTK